MVLHHALLIWLQYLQELQLRQMSAATKWSPVPVSTPFAHVVAPLLEAKVMRFYPYSALCTEAQSRERIRLGGAKSRVTQVDQERSDLVEKNSRTE